VRHRRDPMKTGRAFVVRRQPWPGAGGETRGSHRGSAWAVPPARAEHVGVQPTECGAVGGLGIGVRRATVINRSRLVWLLSPANNTDHRKSTPGR
jgi:hypothetical protein